MKDVNATIITIGDELLIGQTIDTNSAFIAQELNRIGVWVKGKQTVGDMREDMLAALRKAEQESDVVIITGGLGPTADDITKPVLCEFFNTKLVEDAGALENVRQIFTRLGKAVTERNAKQALVPEACTVLPNLRGTAPGMWFEKKVGDRKVFFVSLPGVPHEMRGLVLNSVVPMIQKNFELPTVAHRTLITAGVGESELADHIQEFEENLPPHIKLAYLPSYGMVRLRLTARYDAVQTKPDVDDYFSRLKQLVQQWLVVDEDITLQQYINQLFKEKQLTLGTAESCTGGYIAHLITSVPGSSALFKGSVVSYANELKESLLGVSPDTLQQHGAVSEETVREMVKGALKVLKTDYAIATSGILGPDGGTPEKPVGTVWIAVGNTQEILARKFFFRFDRTRNTTLAAYNALNLLRQLVLRQLPF